jgi:hypothetical protein
MSGFFKDMFELPDSDGENNQSRATSDPLRLTETSQTIELLLQHMDPKCQQYKNIDPDTIVDLLEAARKYQVPSITVWFENEIRVKRTLIHTTAIPGQQASLASEPFLAADPLLSLYCALRFDLPGSGRLALKEFAECDASLIESTTQEISLRVYFYGMTLRRERIELFQGFIVQLTKLKVVTDYSPSSRRMVTFQPDTGRKTCATCTASRASWVFTLESAVCKQPTWVSFVAAYEASGGGCATCNTSSWADYYRGCLKDWEGKAKEVEQELPEWPGLLAVV